MIIVGKRARAALRTRRLTPTEATRTPNPTHQSRLQSIRSFLLGSAFCSVCIIFLLLFRSSTMIKAPLTCLVFVCCTRIRSLHWFYDKAKRWEHDWREMGKFSSVIREEWYTIEWQNLHWRILLRERAAASPYLSSRGKAAQTNSF